MSQLETYLAEHVDETFPSSDDVAHTVLPLFKQLLETHEQDLVAPLEGLCALHIEQAGIWFSAEDAHKAKYNDSAIRNIDKANTGAFKIITESNRINHLGQNDEEYQNRQVIERDQEVTSPAYLPGYICWEHQLEHHDPLSDIFVAGLILASVACNLNFNHMDDLKLFVENRRNLFRIRPDLDPVIAKLITQTTELSRHTRLGDLQSVYRTLKHYREQDLDIDYELLKISDFETKPQKDKQKIILSKLQERLFEVSRRNKLLHFTSTRQTVNLTQASVPLSCDVQNIKPSSLITWGHEFKDLLLKEKPLLLNNYLNVNEALYLPGQLDLIRSEANRDLKEFGFAQLKLVVCFLAWSNLKDSAKERLFSPLILLPVNLTKKKGVKDKYWLEALDSEAEINPVLRHQFKELYDISLPETINLKTTELNTFHQWLAYTIETSDKSVTLEFIDKPKMDIIHQAAKRRLDQYNRRSGLSGRYIQKYGNIDYSYSPSNLHPLGLRLFNQRIRNTPTQLQRIISDIEHSDIQFMVETRNRNSADDHAQSKTKAFYSLREDDETNPYHWQFDTCNITLGNFKYRKMSLVKDYTRLLAESRENRAFEATFSLNPRPLQDNPESHPDPVDTYHIVPCDPTQASAIELAKQGENYIIQGPPGTGKSQTITNLIADYVARGKKILFVCEKRAAIDIVYLRLKQLGLSSICSLIHDSQTDKKQFIMDLKATYEGFLAQEKQEKASAETVRQDIITRLKESLEPLRGFDEKMTEALPSAGMPLNQLLTLVIENIESLPPFTMLELERFPDYAVWQTHHAELESLKNIINDIQVDGILASHPLALLHERFLDVNQPMNEAAELFEKAQGYLQQVIEQLHSANQALDFDAHSYSKASDLNELLGYIQQLEVLARPGLTCLFNESDPLTREFNKTHKKYLKRREKILKAQEKTQHWRDKLPPDESETALVQASAVTGIFGFLSPNWWRLRKVLNASYDFSAHKIKPKWVQILTWLNDEYRAVDEMTSLVNDARIEFGFEGEFEPVINALESIQASVADRHALLRPLHDAILKHVEPTRITNEYMALTGSFPQLDEILSRLFQNYQAIPLDALSEKVNAGRSALNTLPEYLLCLKQLRKLPDSLSELFRTYKLDTLQLQTTIAHKTVNQLVKSQPSLNNMVSKVKQQYVNVINKYHQSLYQHNARAILDRVRRQFLENMQLTNMPAAELSTDQKQFKKIYNSGRRELEHEFGKSMRYKSIRDMVANQSGMVINDLKRVWLMSPLSVSDTLPLDDTGFDAVIFDEASQITLEEAIPSIFRANQAIVVGDQMQLPPTNFFSANTDSEDDTLEILEDNEVVEYDLNSNSFLSHVSNNLLSRRLGWHYRSRSESLISFSNWSFYQGSLLSVPDVIANSDERVPIVVRDPVEGDENAKSLPERAISFHWLAHGVYENRRNNDEASYIARLVRGLLLSSDQKSIGIVAFSEAQQSEIEKALNKLADEDRGFRDRLEEEYEREQDGEFVGMLVKNLENIQGDERDIIIMSVCYGYNHLRKMRMNFGPINQKGGEKRLNVAFSRARQHMVVVSSIKYSDITNDYNEGANALKTYLQYAEKISIGDETSANRILYNLSYTDFSTPSEAGATLHPALSQIKQEFEQRGWLVDSEVGHSHFKCDLAIRKPGDEKYSLGIFLDTNAHYEQKDIIERDLLKPQLLRNFGWRILNLLAKDWYEDRERVIGQIYTILEIPDQDAVDLAEEIAEPFASDKTIDTVNEASNEPAVIVEERDLEPETNDVTDTPIVESEPPEALTTGEQTSEQEKPDTSMTLPPGADTPPPLRVAVIVPEKKVYLEFVGGNSSKFWSVTVTGREHSVHYGRIGTNGQSTTKQFESEQAALNNAEKLVNQKLNKGYRIVKDSDS